MSAFHTLRVAALSAETADACSIHLDIPPRWPTRLATGLASF